MFDPGSVFSCEHSLNMVRVCVAFYYVLGSVDTCPHVSSPYLALFLLRVYQYIVLRRGMAENRVLLTHLDRIILAEDRFVNLLLFCGRILSCSLLLKLLIMEICQRLLRP